MREPKITLDGKAAAKRFRHMREILGLSQAALAASIGASRSTVARWEKRVPDSIRGTSLLLLKRAHPAVSIDWLLSGEGEPLKGVISHRTKMPLIRPPGLPH